MPFHRIGLTTLTGGVSRQAPGLRSPTQLEECDNMNLSFARGNERRAGSAFVCNVVTTAIGDGKAIWYESSAGNLYCLIFRNNGTTPIVAFNATTGAAVTVTYNGDATALKAYLNSTTPKTSLREVVVGDTIIVVNRDVATALVNDSSPVVYTYGGPATDVTLTSNAHNKNTWLDFPQPATSTTEYWYARESTFGHPQGWWKAASTSVAPWYTRQRSTANYSTFDPDTMPVKIYFDGSAFQIYQIDWEPRYFLDDTDNPPPSFANKKIKSVAFARDRLWFGGEGFLCGSRSGDYYNYWIHDPSNETDSDRIDLTIGLMDLGSSIVKRIFPFNRSLLLQTNGGQWYEVWSQDAMTPSTVQVAPMVATAPVTGAVQLLRTMYFIANYGSISKAYEVQWDSAGVLSSMNESSMFVDSYLPGDPEVITASQDGLMAFTLHDGSPYVWVFQTYWVGNERRQAAFHRWLFHDDTIWDLTSIFVRDEFLYLLFREISSGDYRVSRVNVEQADSNGAYHCYLDDKSQVTGTYNPATATTAFTLPYDDDTLDTIWLGSEWSSDDRYATATTGTATGGTLTVNGDYSDHACWVGRPYESSFELSEQVVLNPRDGSQVVGTIQLRQLTLFLKNTAYFEVQVTPTNRDTKIYPYTPNVIGIFQAGVVSIPEFAKFTVPVLASANAVSIRVTTSEVAPMTITGGEFATIFTPARRSPTGT